MIQAKQELLSALAAAIAEVSPGATVPIAYFGLNKVVQIKT